MFISSFLTFGLALKISAGLTFWGPEARKQTCRVHCRLVMSTFEPVIQQYPALFSLKLFLRTGVFAAQEAALFKKFKIRRIQGLAIDGEWFKTEMKLLVQESDHPRKDQFKGSNKRLSKFCRRNGLSSQRKTNKKSKSILERLPKIKNFHYYTVYKMGLEKI